MAVNSIEKEYLLKDAIFDQYMASVKYKMFI